MKCKCGHGKKYHHNWGSGTLACYKHLAEHDGKTDYCECNEYRPVKKVKEYDFNFTVSFPGYKKDAAETLAAGIMDLVTTYVETFHGQVGGGFNENAE